MSMTIIATPTTNENKPQNKGVASIHYGKNISATVFIREKEDGSLTVVRPGYKTKDGDMVNFFGLKGEGSIKNMISDVLKAYEAKLAGAENPAVEDIEVKDIEVMRVGVLKDSSANKKGLASVKINDEFVINNIDIVEGKNGMFIGFPHVFNKETKEEKEYVSVVGRVKKDIEQKVLEAYEKKVAKSKDTDTKEKESDFMGIPDGAEKEEGVPNR